MSTFQMKTTEVTIEMDGPHLIVRSDWRDRMNYKGPWVDLDRGIPGPWVPVLYTTPPAPAQPWVNLTVDELIDLEHKHRKHEDLVRAIEAKLKEKNT
jgi:hypothetical protein